MAKHSQQWTWLEPTLYALILAVLFVPSSLIDGVAERTSTLVRLGVGGACLAGLIVHGFYKKLAGAREPADLPEAPEEASQSVVSGPVLELRYQTTLENSWRCIVDGLIHSRATTLILFTMSLPVALLAAGFISGFSRDLAIYAFPPLCVLGSAFWLSLTIAGTQHQLGERFPTAGAARECTAILNSEGFRDLTPDKIYFFEWSRVTGVREHRGDVFVRSGLRAGCFIPSEAFADREAAMRFSRAAMILWRSRGTTWPDEEPGSFAPVPARELTGEPDLPPAYPGNDNPFAPPRQPYSAYAGLAGSLATHLSAIGGTFAFVFLAGGLISMLFWMVR